MEPKGVLQCSQEAASPSPCLTFGNKLSFYGEELLSPLSTPKLLHHPLSALRNCLFNIFPATLRT
jgi:hypothetical protein